MSRFEAQAPAGIVYDELVHVSRGLLPAWQGVGPADPNGIRVFYTDESDPAPAAVIAWQTAVAALTPGSVDSPRRNFDTILAAWPTIMGQMQAIIDTPDLPAGTLNGSQLSNAARAMQTQQKQLARAIRRIARLVAGELDGAA